ncbi:MAG TPA: GNAT family N-acetyltransferase [Tepidisphaeraceae bacterium]|jgi:GNAT superfamily N-acetyltransferase|nr:GNAT family N-acetyltransferase [Tepidisphaeraceae bacterium]
MQLRLAHSQEILSLRSSILRPGKPISASMYLGDDSIETLHAGAFVMNECIGCATLLREPFESQDAYRLRGMAIHPTYQRSGIGRSLLQFLVPLAAARVSILWCNARLPAVPFYARLGWQVIGDVFDIPEAGGPHYRMWLDLKVPAAI